MNDLLLDRAGNALAPEGYQVIDSEVAFLQQATKAGRYVVRGARLCHWAAEFWKARGLAFGELLSPTASLRQIVPTLDENEADAIVAALPDGLRRDLGTTSLSHLLQGLFPNALWQMAPSRDHAAEWLLWLYGRPNDGRYEPLLAEQSRHWQREADDVNPRVYAATNANAAGEILDIWLGVTREPLLYELGEFPRPIPRKLRDRVIKAWRNDLISRRAALVKELEQYPIPFSLLRSAAEETVKYLEHHPGYLTSAEQTQLARYLTAADQLRLLKLLPPSLPADLPMAPTAVLAWFRDQYVPARQWQAAHGSNDDAEQLSRAARQFAFWYLERYPRALVGDEFLTHLSFDKAASLQQRDDDYVTLLIILDGLHQLDGIQLAAAIQGEAERLSVWNDGLAFSPLPTVTQFCKPALFAGIQPERATEVGPVGRVLPENVSPIDELSAAVPGDLFLWRIVEPDRTYHMKNSSETLRRDIDSQLDAVAAKISDIVSEVPGELPLRIVVTSDHGRLLVKSTRAVAVPAGMESHGRAAWGPSGRQFGKDGFLFEDPLVFLHASRFGLPADAAIVFSEDSFRMNDGRSGSEWYPHGGLYPEEIIVPWIEFVRDATQPSLTFALGGSAQAGKRGDLIVSIRNPEQIPVELVGLTLTMNRRQVTLELGLTVPPFDEATHTISLDPWPTKAEKDQLTATVEVRLPNRQKFTSPITNDSITIDSTEMYEREDILGDLDL